MAKIIFDTSALDKEKIVIEEELIIVAEQVNDCIAENARKVQNQDDYEIRYASLATRFNDTKNRFEEVSREIFEKKSRKEVVELFIKDLDKQELIVEFDKIIWLSMVEYMTVHHDGSLEFTFLDGNNVKIER